jgi:hypothetical protein
VKVGLNRKRYRSDPIFAASAAASCRQRSAFLRLALVLIFS